MEAGELVLQLGEVRLMEPGPVDLVEGLVEGGLAWSGLIGSSGDTNNPGPEQPHLCQAGAGEPEPVGQGVGEVAGGWQGLQDLGAGASCHQHSFYGWHSVTTKMSTTIPTSTDTITTVCANFS